jgi:hypothetical protein
MIFKQLFDQETSTYTYLLADSDTREAVIIDPVAEKVERDLKLIDELGLNLRYVLDTHVHADHVTGSGASREATGAETAVSAAACVPCADRRLVHGERISLGALEIEARIGPVRRPVSNTLESETCMGGWQVDELLRKTVGNEGHNRFNGEHSEHLAVVFDHGKVPVRTLSHQL